MTQDREPLMPDQAVSEAYRQLATERAPSALDARVLAVARAEARTRYGLLRTRTRPLAWAAMIGLSLVIVLQIVRLPDGSEAQRLETTVPATPEAGRSREDRALVSEEAPAAARLVTPEEASSRDNKAVVSEESAAAAAPAELSPAPAAALRGKPGLAEAEPADLPERDAVAAEQRQHQFRDTPASAFVEGLSKMSAPPDSEREEAFATLAGSNCSKSARETPESWLECVEALRERGDAVAADAEYELLRAAFPDFAADEGHK